MPWSDEDLKNYMKSIQRFADLARVEDLLTDEEIQELEVASYRSNMLEDLEQEDLPF